MQGTGVGVRVKGETPERGALCSSSFPLSPALVSVTFGCWDSMAATLVQFIDEPSLSPDLQAAALEGVVMIVLSIGSLDKRNP